MRKIIKWLKKKLGMSALESLVQAYGNRIQDIENLVHVGADLNFKTPSWIVVCLRGKNDQDIVRFFELPDNYISNLLEELKEMERRYHIKPVFDAPSYIKKEYLRW